MEKKKVLFISQEISPFLPKSEVATTVRNLAQGIQEGGKEIRVFMPRFGVINERRHHLHEVIRLSGMTLIIDDNDHPLIIKVASISAARMQVYFIDNDDYKPDNIIGKWQLEKEIEDGIEHELTECAKNMNIQFFEDGIYEEKDFYNEGLECIADEVKKGNWKNLGNNMYEITDIDVPEIKVTFESANTKMIVEFSETIDNITHTEKLIFINVNS